MRERAALETMAFTTAVVKRVACKSIGYKVFRRRLPGKLISSEKQLKAERSGKVGLAEENKGKFFKCLENFHFIHYKGFFFFFLFLYSEKLTTCGGVKNTYKEKRIK